MAAEWRVSEWTARARINLIFRTVLAHAKSGPVTVYRLGRFEYRMRKAYRKPNAKTGAIETVPARRILRFKAAPSTRR